MNSIIRCYTARDIHNLHPEWYKCEVDRLRITELDQDEIECSELNCWICDVLRVLDNELGAEIWAAQVAVFISATNMNRPLIIESDTLALIVDVKGKLELFSE